MKAQDILPAPALAMGEHVISIVRGAARLETLVHVTRDALQTVPSGEDAREVPALGPEVHPAPAPRATAAHPHAFRGTRHRPPKPTRPEAVGNGLEELTERLPPS